MHGCEILMHLWRCLLGGSSGIVTSIIANTGGQYWYYVLMPLHSLVISQDARPKIVHTPLRLISRMGQRACRMHFHLSRPPILPCWINNTMQPLDCWMGKKIDRWRSVDAHLTAIVTVIGCSTIVHRMQAVIIDSQYIVSMYNHMYPQASRPLSFWATSTHVIWMMNEVGELHFSALGWQCTT